MWLLAKFSVAASPGHSRFVTLDNFLLSKLRRSEKPSGEILWPWRQLDLSRGANGLGVSIDPAVDQPVVVASKIWKTRNN